MPTVTTSAPATFTLSAFQTVRVQGAASATGTIAFESLAPKLQSDSSATLVSKTYGPFGAPMNVTIRATSGSWDYTIGTADTLAPNWSDSTGSALVDPQGRHIGVAPTLVNAEYFGVQAGVADMTTQLETALNAAFYEGWQLVLPYGDVNISGLMTVTAPDGLQNYTTYYGTTSWRRPVGVRGHGPLASRIVQNTAGVGIAHYMPTSGNIAQAQFADFCLVNVNEDYTNTGQFGIQIGGGATSVVGEQHRFSSVSAQGLYAVLRLDDVSGPIFTGSFQNARFKYYVEAGYNADQYTFRDFLYFHDHPVAVSCTSSTGTTITGIPAGAMPYLFVGGTIVGSGVPADTTIVSKGTTSIEVSNSVTAVTSFDFKLGTLLSLLGTSGSAYSGSGWAAIANAANYYNKTRASNPNLCTFDNVLAGRVEGLIEDYGSVYALNMRGIYLEAVKRIARFAGSALLGVSIDGIFLSQPSCMRQPMIEIVPATARGRIANIVTDGSPTTTTGVNMPNANSGTEWGPLEIVGCYGNVVTGGAPALSSAARSVMLGTSLNGSATYAYSTASGNADFDGMGVDRVTVTLERSGRTINGPNSTHPVEGRKLQFVFIQNATGGWSITLATKYKKPDGTNWGLLPTGAANLRATLTFTHLGNGLYVSDSDTLTYV